MSRRQSTLPAVDLNQWQDHLDTRSADRDWKEMSFRRVVLPTSADLSSHLFDGSDFEGVDFQKADIRGASFRNCSLRGCDLSEVVGATDVQFAGADLDGAVLPESVAEFKQLSNIEELSKNAGKISASMLLVTTFAILTVLQSKDSDFFAIGGDTKLPLLDTTVPIRVFYFVTPLLLVVIYLYLHLHLQRLWEALSKLPAVFPSGRRIDETVYPWLQNELVVRDMPRLEGRCPPLSRLHHVLYSFLAWWLVPAVLGHFWFRFLTRHDVIVTTWHIGLLLTTVFAAVYLRRLASSTLRPTHAAQPSKGRSNFFRVGYVVLFISIFVGLVKLGNVLRFPAQIIGAELSKPSSSNVWDTPLSSVAPVRLDRADLKGAYIASSFMAGAELNDVRLNFARVKRCDLRGVTSQRCRAIGARFEQSDLSSCALSGTLAQAEFKKCDLRKASIQMVLDLDNDLKYLKDRDITLLQDSNGDGMKEINLQVRRLERSTMRGITGTVRAGNVDSLVLNGLYRQGKSPNSQSTGETKLRVKALTNGPLDTPLRSSLVEKAQVYIEGEKSAVVTIEGCVFSHCYIASGLTLNSGPRLKFVNCCFIGCRFEGGLTSPIFEDCFRDAPSLRASDSKATPNDEDAKVKREVTNRRTEFDRIAKEIAEGAGLTDRDPGKKDAKA